MNATASLQDSMTEGRYRLLVDAITDYAIYMLDPDGYVSSWNAGAARSKAIRSRKFSANIFRSSICLRIVRQACRSGHWRRRHQRDVLRGKAGASGRMGRATGLMS